MITVTQKSWESGTYLSTSLCRLEASLACWVAMVSGSREYRLMLISFLPSSLYLTWLNKTGLGAVTYCQRLSLCNYTKSHRYTLSYWTQNKSCVPHCRVQTPPWRALSLSSLGAESKNRRPCPSCPPLCTASKIQKKLKLLQI